ncbi:DUF4411 family protein [Dehalobacterium formicoaceticum]|uniref:DUF4411 family protein n=1 Tax=Dehalobacterium formicoaceticum TaxID=51515 RepID=A0ABT1YA71_9FIRM|nr:DUF4411 family protein [Dehalobacterium formicoaceticum]MCR6547000.1 DUF4411 family protein [Dehalobacterium formicoaceticum]
MNRKYFIDANILITAHRSYYPFDIAPGFWDQFIEKASSKVIFIEKVSDEILRGEDQLSDWYQENSANFILMKIPDTNVINSYSRIINSINSNIQYKQSAKDEFATLADSWLCAYGLAYKHPVLTLEKYQANSKKRILIPNICREFKIECIDLFQFMRETKFKL